MAKHRTVRVWQIEVERSQTAVVAMIILHPVTVTVSVKWAVITGQRVIVEEDLQIIVVSIEGIKDVVNKV